MVRKPVGKKDRFEIFKRDGFKCQYCGKIPPNVILVVDHIVPVKNGGTNISENLLTSCEECNQGKGAISLTNIPKKVSANIKALEEKKEQLKDFYTYQKKMDKLVEKKVEYLANVWSECWDNRFSLNNRGKSTIRTSLKFLPVSEIEESMYIATGRIKDINACFRYLCGILNNKKKDTYGKE